MTSFFPLPVADLLPNTLAFETYPLIKETGFREYDVRWIFGKDLNLMGVQALGMALGTLLHAQGIRPDLVTGHDFRSYSSCIKMALINGLMVTGIRVHDIGLALSPMAYFAQFALDIPAVAMVTASHNENGWTGLKMGMDPPLTFGPSEILRLKEIVQNAAFVPRPGGSYVFYPDFSKVYYRALVRDVKLKERVKVVCACGNGTAGAFAPKILKKIGADVVPLDCGLDPTFPNYNPNPEDLKMLQAVSEMVLNTKAAIGLAFDGDGDRCGVVDNEGKEIFADKIGVLLARDICHNFPGRKIVVDVKSTALFQTDPVLNSLAVDVVYCKTGHSYMKRCVQEVDAILGVEKSGHYFFNAPIGYGYDDGVRSAIAILEMLDHVSGQSLADLARTLPPSWNSPTISAECPDTEKYAVVDRIKETLIHDHKTQIPFAGQKIENLLLLNGVRVTSEDGTWGLVRASSNKPEIVIVVESPVSYARMRAMFEALDGLLRLHPEVGVYNQTFGSGDTDACKAVGA